MVRPNGSVNTPGPGTDLAACSSPSPRGEKARSERGAARKETTVNYLKQERATLEKLLPGLDATLAGFPLMEMERPGNPSIPAFRRLGGPGLLIPARFGGRGASPLQAVRAQRAIACRAPSLAVATTMHHFTIATLLEIDPSDPGLEGELLESVARDNLY